MEERQDLKTTLIKNLGYTKEEAEREIAEARQDAMQRIEEGEMPYDICEEYWGLEPDYLEDFML